MDRYLCCYYVLQSSPKQASMLTRSAYIHLSINRRQPIVKLQVLGEWTPKILLVHSPEKRSPVFGPNLCLLVIGTYGSELYGMESKNSRQVGWCVYSSGTSSVCTPGMLHFSWTAQKIWVVHFLNRLLSRLQCRILASYRTKMSQ